MKTILKVLRRSNNLQRRLKDKISKEKIQFLEVPILIKFLRELFPINILVGLEVLYLSLIHI